MEEGKIILTVFQQDAARKLRPALVLREFPKYGDLLVCGISSRLYQYIPEFDLLLDESHPDFKQSGLKAPAVCRLNMLTMLPKESVSGSLGKISAAEHFKLVKNLADYLVNKKSK